MINRIIGICIRKRLVVVMVAILLAVFGYYSWTKMAVEAYPDIGDVTAQVITPAPGLASEEVEQQITIPLERALAGTPGLSNMRSSSTFGLSLITIIFNDGAEDYWSRQRITERINQVNLPSGIQPGLDPVTGPVGEIYRYTLESDTKNLMELSEIQRWTVIPALEAGGRSSRCRQLRRFYHAVSTGTRSGPTPEFRHRPERRGHGHQQQQLECGRQPHLARRTGLCYPRHRHGAHAGRPRRHRRHAAQRRADPGA